MVNALVVKSDFTKNLRLDYMCPNWVFPNFPAGLSLFIIVFITCFVKNGIVQTSSPELSFR